MSTYTEQEIREMLWALIRDRKHPARPWLYKSQAALAKRIGIDGPHLSHVLRGTKPLDGRTLQYLGMERVVTYQRRTSHS